MPVDDVAFADKISFPALPKVASAAPPEVSRATAPCVYAVVPSVHPKWRADDDAVVRCDRDRRESRDRRARSEIDRRVAGSAERRVERAVRERARDEHTWRAGDAQWSGERRKNFSIVLQREAGRLRDRFVEQDLSARSERCIDVPARVESHEAGRSLVRHAGGDGRRRHDLSIVLRDKIVEFLIGRHERDAAGAEARVDRLTSNRHCKGRRSGKSHFHLRRSTMAPHWRLRSPMRGT